MIRTFLLTFLATQLLTTVALGAETYTLGPDSQRRPGVPQGTLTEHRWTNSRIFPGTVRSYWIYVPAGAEKSKPLPFMIFQDGSGFVKENSSWRTTTVLDNLIASKAIPPMAAIFIDPGVLPAPNANAEGRYNRSYEYDGMSDRYARFLIEEILPEAGRVQTLSTDPNDRGLCGSSSGGIAAFTAAWNRPDAFRRVISFIGSYTNLRGGDAYPALVRKMEPKPLRVFLQDGDHDLNIYSGSWWMANQSMASALEYAGYETKFVSGTEGHNSVHGSAILPDALRWLWAGYPQPVRGNDKPGERHYVREFLDPSSQWELISEGHGFADGPAADKTGNLFFVDPGRSTLYRLDAAGKPAAVATDTAKARGLAFGPDGKLYAATDRGISVFDAQNKTTILSEGEPANDLAVTTKGGVYYTELRGKRVFYIEPGGRKRVVSEELLAPNGVRLSPDESLLLVADYGTRHVWSFAVQPDGSLANGQPFYRLEVPEDPHPQRGVSALADGMALDNEGHLYVATAMGVQICDQPGRVIAIIGKPGTAPVNNVTFGGPDRNILYVTAGDKLWRRKLRRTGLTPGAPVKPPKPRL